MCKVHIDYVPLLYFVQKLNSNHKYASKPGNKADRISFLLRSLRFENLLGFEGDVYILEGHYPRILGVHCMPSMISEARQNLLSGLAHVVVVLFQTTIKDDPSSSGSQFCMPVNFFKISTLFLLLD